MSLSEALMSLCPGAQWSAVGEDYSTVVWHVAPETIPTQDEIDAEVARLQADYIAKQYQRDRRPEYPSLATFADAYYWAQKGDNTKMDEYVAACDAVKTKYPKPE